MSPLIAAASLARLLAEEPVDRRPVLLDVRWRLAGPPGILEYQAGHLPGAIFVDLDTVLADPPTRSRGRHPLPDPDRLAARLAAYGVSDDSSVVCYDESDGSVAARAWWLLRWLGLPPDRVRVLDGGYRGWVAEGYPVDQEIPQPVAGRLTPKPGSMPVLDATAAAEVAGCGVLLDARAPERYRGETEPVDPRAGHIPGARNSPFTDHVGPDGRWRDVAWLREHYAALGIRDAQKTSQRVGAYCGSGVTAASVVLALEHAGLRPPERPAALYAGSWSEWSANPHRPIAVGAEPGSDPGSDTASDTGASRR